MFGKKYVTQKFRRTEPETINFLIVFMAGFSNSAEELESCYTEYKTKENFRKMTLTDFFEFLGNEQNKSFLTDCDLFIFHFVGHSTGSEGCYPVLFNFHFGEFIEELECMENNVVAFIDCCNNSYTSYNDIYI